MKQVSVRISEDIHQQLREKTVKEKTTVQDVMNSMIESYLNENKTDGDSTNSNKSNTCWNKK